MQAWSVGTLAYVFVLDAQERASNPNLHLKIGAFIVTGSCFI